MRTLNKAKRVITIMLALALVFTLTPAIPGAVENAYAPKIVYTFVESQNWSGKKMITLCTSGGSGLGRSGTDLSKFAKGVDFKGGKDFTRGSAADVKKYIEGLLK